MVTGSSQTNKTSSGRPLSNRMRMLAGTGVILIGLFLLVGALSVPFRFESPSMWYKFGIAKAALRSGKLLGLAAGLLILLQLILAGRLRCLDRLFSLPALMRQHRIHAWAILLMAVAHPLCVLLSEGKLLIPLEMRYWPEWVGVGLLVLLLVQVVASQWRRPLKVAFHLWLPLHRIGGLLIAGLMILHVLYVSESFSEPGPPRQAVWMAAALYGLLWLWVRSGWLRARRRPYEVSRVATTGSDSTIVELTPTHRNPSSYMPGQFAIVSFRSKRLSAEPHAFTLSSTPSRGNVLQFTIRASGDWTRRVGRLQPGETAWLQGPYGRFGHLFCAVDRELIMIAGGIGITPMLSMLRFMADGGDSRPITLIWSNRSARQVVFAEEIADLETKLTGLRCIPIFTRDAESPEHTGRLNRTTLASLLTGANRQSAVFICGPPGMMAQLRHDLKALGFPARSLFSEAFGF